MDCFKLISKLILVPFSIALLAACNMIKPAPDACQTVVKYSGYKVEISGLEIQGLKFKLGSAVWGDVLLQQAQDVTQALDVIQFGDCQSARLLPASDPQRSQLIAASVEVRKALVAHLTSFEQAKTPTEAGAALTAAKQDANKLAAGGDTSAVK
jgi:hypothetical protein